jgi:glutathione S-transferase
MELKSDEVFFPQVVNCMPNRRKALGEEGFHDSVERIHEYFAEIDALLSDRDYLCGGFGYADIAFYSAPFFARFLQQGPSEGLGHLERWCARMVGRESVRTVMGEMVGYLAANGPPATL